MGITCTETHVADGPLFNSRFDGLIKLTFIHLKIYATYHSFTLVYGLWKQTRIEVFPITAKDILTNTIRGIELL
jgi:hypothetical protein